MSTSKRSPALQGIEVRTDASGRKRYRGTARDKIVGKHLRGPWTGSLAEARAWRVDAQARLQAGTLTAASGPTVAEAAEKFIAGVKSGSIRQKGGHIYKPSTVRGYERDLNKHALPELGAKRIDRLQRPELQRWVDGMTTPERSPSTIKNIVAALRALIGFAELRGWSHFNPCEGLRLPAGEEARDRIASPSEAATLIAALRPDDRLALGLAVYAGLRLGELLALDVSGSTWMVAGSMCGAAGIRARRNSFPPRPGSRARCRSSTGSLRWPLTTSCCSTTRARACSSRAPTIRSGQRIRRFCDGVRTSGGTTRVSRGSGSTREGIPSPALGSPPA